MDLATLKEQAERCRRLAKHADPFTQKRLLDLASEYDAKIAKLEPQPSAATRILRNGEPERLAPGQIALEILQTSYPQHIHKQFTGGNFGLSAAAFGTCCAQKSGYPHRGQPLVAPSAAAFCLPREFCAGASHNALCRAAPNGAPVVRSVVKFSVGKWSYRRCDQACRPSYERNGSQSALSQKS